MKAFTLLLLALLGAFAVAAPKCGNDDECRSAAQTYLDHLNTCLKTGPTGNPGKNKAECLTTPFKVGADDTEIVLLKQDKGTVPQDYFGREYSQPLSAVCYDLYEKTDKPANFPPKSKCETKYTKQIQYPCSDFVMHAIPTKKIP